MNDPLENARTEDFLLIIGKLYMSNLILTQELARANQEISKFRHEVREGVHSRKQTSSEADS